MTRIKPSAMRKAKQSTYVFGSHRMSRIGLVRFDWRDPYYTALTLGWPGFSALMLALMGLINVVFAILYMLKPGCVMNMQPYNFAQAFFFSLETMATVGYGVMAPVTLYGHVVSGIEIVTGMAFTAIATGLMFVRFSKTRSKILYADHAVVARHNGQPTLMLRIANGRAAPVTHASVALYVLLAEQSSEGRIYWRTHDLALQRARMPFLAMSWTLMHTLDEHSPLHGFTRETLEDRRARLFITVDARDHVFGTSIQDVWEYDCEQIQFGKHFADAVSVAENGDVVADLTRLSLLEDDPVLGA